MRRLLPLAWLILALLPWPARAAEGLVVRLSPPDTTAFPQISTYVQVWDAAGHFVDGLEARHFTVIEDGRYRGVDSLEAVAPGVQFALAVQPGETFRIRDANGRTRWDYLLAFWQDWSANQPAAQDDVSLILAGGAEQTHRRDLHAWGDALATYTPDFAAPPALTALSRALEVVADPTPRPGMGRAVLLITPPLPPDAETVAGVQTLSTLALQNGVSVSVWMVAAPTLRVSPQADLLRTLTTATQGTFAVVSAPEDIPDPAPWLEAQRHAYRLTYTARPAVGEAHTLQLWLHAPQGEARSAEVPFAFQVQPPNPIFVQPPTSVERQPADRSRQALLDFAAYRPQQVPIEVLIDFPDGHPRPLREVTLLLDGRVLARATAPPFDRFLWDVRDITQDERHRLQLEAVDAGGLVGRSIEITVEVRVPRPEERLSTLLYLNLPRLALAAVLFTLALAFLGLVLSGRLAPKVPFADVRPRRAAAPTESRPPAAPARPRGVRWRWPRRHATPTAPAYLEPLDGQGRLPIQHTDLTLGSDPARAVLHLDDPSVSPLHARLRREADGYRLLDAGSVAGTWVNYEPVPPEGIRLQSGDLIHLGRVAFRFWITAEPAPEPTILPLGEG